MIINFNVTNTRTSLARRAMAVLISGALAAGTASAADTSNQTFAQQQQIDALQQQLLNVQTQVKELADQNQALLRRLEYDEHRSDTSQAATAQPSAMTDAGGPPAGASATDVTPAGVTRGGLMPSGNPIPPGALAVSPGSAVLLGGTSAFSNVKMWGYGELYYTRPTREPNKAEADLARAVFGIGYSFDDRTEFNSEFEVEHAVSSASAVGEFDVEQFYVDRQLNELATLRAGLFLMPFGLINEHHEPTNFYGMQRNFVETLIIPSTWREGGFNLHGETPIGFSWNAGLTTGFDLSKWNFAPEFPLYATALDLEASDSAPLQATHQELALANAHSLSQYLALGYYGIPGLTLGAAISTGNAAQVAASPNAPILGNERVTLWEAHVRWTPGKFDLAVLYAHGSISNLASVNASNLGSRNPMPSEFYGYYAQAAYALWEHGDYRLAPFVRWEYYDLGSRYSGIDGPVVPSGLLPLSATSGDYGHWPRNYDRVSTVGANFYTTPHMVFKLDYQWFEDNREFDRVDVGMGLAF